MVDGKPLWLPASYNGKSIKGPNGECLPCKDTGAVFYGLRLINPRCNEGRIDYVERVEMDWRPCDCRMGQLWRRFHPLNVQARLLLKGKPWHEVVIDELERVKSKIIRDAGGSYVPFQDTFLQNLDNESAFRRDTSHGDSDRRNG